VDRGSFLQYLGGIGSLDLGQKIGKGVLWEILNDDDWDTLGFGDLAGIFGWCGSFAAMMPNMTDILEE